MLTHELDGDATLTVGPGERFALATSESGGTGYLWSVEAGPGVEHAGTEYRDGDERVGTVGGPRDRVDVFVCATRGIHAIAMRHARPWLADDGRRVRITVVCRD